MCYMLCAGSILHLSRKEIAGAVGSKCLMFLDCLNHALLIMIM